MSADEKETVYIGIVAFIFQLLLIPADSIALTLALFQSDYDIPYIMTLIIIAPMLVCLYAYALNKYDDAFRYSDQKFTKIGTIIDKLITDYLCLTWLGKYVLNGSMVLLIVGIVALAWFGIGLLLIKISIMCFLTVVMWLCANKIEI